MKTLVHALLRYRALMLMVMAAWLSAGIYFFLQLDIEAYPDPSPPLVEVITQNSAWSAEEMERQITVPIETGIFGIPHLQSVRSISIFGLSDVKLYFEYGSDYFRDRQEVLNRLQQVTLPSNVSPQLSPWSPIGEIYRYRLVGDNFSLNELKSTQDWVVRREIKQVPGVIDVTTFGGATKQYQAEIDPRKLLQYNVTLPQVVNSIGTANANAGGNYLTLGSQNVNVRGLGLLRNIEDMQNIEVAERGGVPVFLSEVADVREGNQPRLGRIGVDGDDDIVEGIVLLQRGEQSLPALEALRQKIDRLNNQILPHGMKIVPIYDRTTLIHMTTHTVREVVIMGIILVTALLLIFLGNVRISFIAATAIPLSLLFAFMMMVLTNQPANLISIGAIDFGILVDTAVVNLEHIHRRLSRRGPNESVEHAIVAAMGEASRPVLFSVMIILVAFIPLITMRGVPGKIFSPMSITYGYSLVGGVLFTLFFAPVLASFGVGKPRPEDTGETRLIRWLRVHYGSFLPWLLRYRRAVMTVAGIVLVAALASLPFVGGEFMPKLEEGNLWVRATLPQDVSFPYAAQLSTETRGILRSFPEVTKVVSQIGRPDDGTDVTGFNNMEFMVQLKPRQEWPDGLTKLKLIEQMETKLEKVPGATFSFSQAIQDNVEEAMSGVKGENSLKLFGDDIGVLASKAKEIMKVMETVQGVNDLAVFPVTGQPQLLVSIDRTSSARYGLEATDVNAAVQAAIGGQAATQILEGDRRFDFVVRYRPEFRQDPDAIRNILLPTPDGGRVPLGQVAQVTLSQGSFMIYRENGRRYVPLKFSVRGRDLASTMEEVQGKLAKQIKLPEGYTYEWAGEYESLQKETRRLAIVIPLSLLIIAALLYMLFNSGRDAGLVMATLPFGVAGGVLTLLVTGTPFSISAAVGFASALGVGTLGASVFLSGIRRVEREGLTGTEAIIEGALEEMRPVMMACLCAGLGLLPAAISTGIGSQAQQPLARVVVGGMLTSLMAILILLPIFASYTKPKPGPEEE